jgi:TRAP-type C4-dicarboxylate transport system permease small subunit
MAEVDDGPYTPLQRTARMVESVVGVISRIAVALAGGTVLATLAMVSYAIITRYVLNRPQSWTDEAVGWLIVVSVMLATPEAQRRAEHIGVDALTERLGARGKWWVALLGIISVAVVGYLFVSEGLAMVSFTRMIGILSNVLPEVPLWAVQALVPIGGALLLMVTASQLFCMLTGIGPRTIHKAKPDALE